MKKIKVLHFVTGGFSGATQVAVDLVKAHLDSPSIEPVLVLRRKRTTTPEKLQRLTDQGIKYYCVTGTTHLATIWQLKRLCQQEIRPDIVVAHGYPEHILGRYAAMWAQVAHLIHVEHNSKERYTWLRLKQARWLAQHTDQIIGCSKGVAQVLRSLGFPKDKVMAIANGVELSRFSNRGGNNFFEREPALIMVSRFAGQKDQISLIKALQLLQRRGIKPKLRLVGGGKQKYLRQAKQLVEQLGLQQQVEFVGHVTDVAALLAQHQVFVLSTHYEGMPLVILEAMAAGCAVIGSDVVGVNELIAPQQTGLLVAANSPAALADAIAQLLNDPVAASKLAQAGQSYAQRGHSIAHMAAQYQQVFETLLQP